MAATEISIAVQPEDFSLQAETEALRAQSRDIGAIVTFSGLVREQHALDERIDSLYLEHYPGMTEHSLQDIAGQAAARWELAGIRVIHRIGLLLPAEQIVFVGVSSAHRQAAFEAAEFIMDYLKTRAPFWKKCRRGEQEFWVEAKFSDDQAANRWARD